jgi:uncharacterized protein YyaL (SSP411 family)
MTKEKKANRLINESSPYLLQHAYNPVEWYPWSDEALNKAVKEDKPIMVSIGYSACHWCHVMERESFENERIANFLNDHFISVKVDREEKPDVDQVYMDAVQAMGVHGGWPLNVFLTPEQKPFFGGTYFPAQSFYKILENVIRAFKGKREKLNLSAEELANHLSKSEVLKYGLKDYNTGLDKTDLSETVQTISEKFDLNYGGLKRAPKFPMPSIWRFLLRYGHHYKNELYVKHALHTLRRMARGVIYDQAGGGFARYSVDEKWFAPHFEKMLYDNGQLLSLYSEAYIISGNMEFHDVIKETADFLKREMLDANGGFYSALDADSEGAEGKFYTWKEEEFMKIIGEEEEFWADYFGVTKEGNWENGRNILFINKGIDKISEKFNCASAEAKNMLAGIKGRLRDKRSVRTRPGLDDKILAGWNGIAMSGLIDAYNVLHDENMLKMALDNAEYLLNNHIRETQLFRTSKDYCRSVPGYLEDYAFVIQAFIKLYQATFNESWLLKTRELLEYAIENFYDSDESFFFYSDKTTSQLIASKKEIFDNVIPSSNAVMAENLFLMGLLFDQDNYINMAKGMVGRMKKFLMTDLEYSSYWGSVYLMLALPIAEIAIVGENASEIRDEMNERYHPNKIFCGTKFSSDLPLLKGRKNLKDNTIYVCYNKSCKLPVHTAEEALQLLI